MAYSTNPNDPTEVSGSYSLFGNGSDPWARADSQDKVRSLMSGMDDLPPEIRALYQQYFLQGDTVSGDGRRKMIDNLTQLLTHYKDQQFNADQADLAYQRTLPENQIQHLMAAGMSRAAAMATLSGAQAAPASSPAAPSLDVTPVDQLRGQTAVSIAQTAFSAFGSLGSLAASAVSMFNQQQDLNTLQLADDYTNTLNSFAQGYTSPANPSGVKYDVPEGVELGSHSAVAGWINSLEDGDPLKTWFNSGEVSAMRNRRGFQSRVYQNMRDLYENGAEKVVRFQTMLQDLETSKINVLSAGASLRKYIVEADIAEGTKNSKIQQAIDEASLVTLDVRGTTVEVDMKEFLAPYLTQANMKDLQLKIASLDPQLDAYHDPEFRAAVLREIKENQLARALVSFREHCVAEKLEDMFSGANPDFTGLADFMSLSYALKQYGVPGYGTDVILGATALLHPEYSPIPGSSATWDKLREPGFNPFAPAGKKIDSYIDDHSVLKGVNRPSKK